MAEPRIDREAVDRAFAEMVAGYHLTADRPDPPPAADGPAGAAAPPRPRRRPNPDATSCRVELARAATTAARSCRGGRAGRATADTQRVRAGAAARRWPAPGSPSWLGWIGIAYAALVVLAADLRGRASRPGPAGSPSADSSCGFGVLITQLPGTARRTPATARSSDLPRGTAGRSTLTVLRGRDSQPTLGVGRRLAALAGVRVDAGRGSRTEPSCGGSRSSSRRASAPGRRRRSARRRCGSGPAPAGPPRGSRGRSASG